jgi:dTMP kinase
MFITFEGGEGTGKTTQIKLLIEYLKEKTGKEIVLTKEPGGTAPAMEIRKALLEGDVDKWDFKEEIGLFYVARSNHIRKLIKPSIEEGKIVVCDRFYDSTMAYQGHRDKKENILQKFHDIYVGDFAPDLTIVLDIDVKEGLRRSFDRANQQHSLFPEKEGSKQNKIVKNQEIRFEEMGLEFHEQVKQAFLDIAKKEPKRCIVVDASGTIEEVKNKIITVLEEDGRIFTATEGK